MRLTKLEIYGFKSFARRTEIVFPQNVTGIVGPNGSGKSNISDAVRWVLGEQSAKNLRGNSMSDVIFNGTEQKKPMNYCEAPPPRLLRGHAGVRQRGSSAARGV